MDGWSIYMAASSANRLENPMLTPPEVQTEQLLGFWNQNLQMNEGEVFTVGLFGSWTSSEYCWEQTSKGALEREKALVMQAPKYSLHWEVALV